VEHVADALVLSALLLCVTGLAMSAAIDAQTASRPATSGATGQADTLMASIERESGGEHHAHERRD